MAVGSNTTGSNTTFGFNYFSYRNPDAETRIVITEKYIPVKFSMDSFIGGGSNSTAIGYSALMSSTTENQNTALGYYSLSFERKTPMPLGSEM